MELPVAYVQPIIAWLKNHPESACIIVFLISFMESLAIIGSIVPGSVMMTMVGIFAGTGVIGLKSSIIAAILGAIAGDGGSYFLGYYFSERLAQLWPFSRYPQWLSYGKTYFERHGGKSVFLGRFVGPLRSLIPAIAGMMKMGHVHFFVANVCSAIGWSILYLGPGILVGAASATLSKETATKLFLVVLGLLFILWLLGMGLKKAGAHLREMSREKLHMLWFTGQNNRFFSPVFKAITPPSEVHHGETFSAVLICSSLILFSGYLFYSFSPETQNNTLDLSIYFFLQSIRTHAFDIFFTGALLLSNPISMLIIVFSQVLSAIFTRHFRLMRYWLMLCLFSFALLLLLNHYFFFHHADVLNKSQTKLFIPVHHLSFSTAVLSFFMLTTLHCCHPLLQKIIKWTLTLLIIFSSIALVYLGENWFSSVLQALSVGLSLSLALWIFYRRYEVTPSHQGSMIFTILLFCMMSLGMLFLNFHHALNQHKPSHIQYMMTHEVWWEQNNSILPMYSHNRIGRPDGLFNIQYLGSIDYFEKILIKHDWKKQSTSMVKNFIAKTDKNKSKMPLKEQFYLNRKPDFIMSYGKKHAKSILILSLWRSNFHLLHHKYPLWIGTLQSHYRSKLKLEVQDTLITVPLNPLLHALRPFKIRTLNMHNTELPGYGTSVKLIIIEETDTPNHY